LALSHATLYYVLQVANKGFRVALNEHPGLRNGLNACNGHITNEYVAFDLGYEFYPPTQVL
jgi:alanine dehydrogenase